MHLVEMIAHNKLNVDGVRFLPYLMWYKVLNSDRVLFAVHERLASHLAAKHVSVEQSRWSRAGAILYAVSPFSI